MSEVLVQFDEPQRTPDGRVFVAQVHGQRTADGLWEAWIEFTPRDGGDPIRTAGATEQLTRGDLRYWAAGLTRADVAAALASALPLDAPPIPRTLLIPELPAADPTHTSLQISAGALTVAESRPPLDPLALYAEFGEYQLRQELRLLDARELRDIIVAHDIPEIELADLARTFEDALAERIVVSVQQRARATATAYEG